MGFGTAPILIARQHIDDAFPGRKMHCILQIGDHHRLDFPCLRRIAVGIHDDIVRFDVEMDHAFVVQLCQPAEDALQYLLLHLRADIAPSKTQKIVGEIFVNENAMIRDCIRWKSNVGVLAGSERGQNLLVEVQIVALQNCFEKISASVGAVRDSGSNIVDIVETRWVVTVRSKSFRLAVLV